MAVPSATGGAKAPNTLRFASMDRSTYDEVRSIAVAETYDADMWTIDGRLRQEVAEHGIRVRRLDKTDAA